MPKLPLPSTLNVAVAAFENPPVIDDEPVTVRLPSLMRVPLPPSAALEVVISAEVDIVKFVTSRVPPVTVALPLRVMVLAPVRVPEDQVRLPFNVTSPAPPKMPPESVRDEVAPKVEDAATFSVPAAIVNEPSTERLFRLVVPVS